MSHKYDVKAFTVPCVRRSSTDIAFSILDGSIVGIVISAESSDVSERTAPARGRQEGQRMRRSEHLRRLRKLAKAHGLVPFVPKFDPKAPLLELRTPETQKAFPNIMRNAGFTEAEIEKRLQEIMVAQTSARALGRPSGLRPCEPNSRAAARGCRFARIVCQGRARRGRIRRRRPRPASATPSRKVGGERVSLGPTRRAS